jgi:hypothetical protein
VVWIRCPQRLQARSSNAIASEYHAMRNNNCYKTHFVKQLRSLIIFKLLLLVALSASAQLPSQVRGPVPVGDGSHPFGAANHTLKPQDLSALGYIEQEYFVSGKANVYNWPERGKLEIRTPDAPPLCQDSCRLY